MRHFWDASKTWHVLFELFHQSSVVSRQDLYVYFYFASQKLGNLMKESWNISSICHQSYVFSISIRFEMFLCISQQFAFFKCWMSYNMNKFLFFSVYGKFTDDESSRSNGFVSNHHETFLFTFYFASRFFVEKICFDICNPFSLKFRLNCMIWNSGVFFPHADQFYRDSINFSNIYTVLMEMLQYVFFDNWVDSNLVV